jgi:hypothetical protein
MTLARGFVTTGSLDESVTQGRNLYGLLKVKTRIPKGLL